MRFEIRAGGFFVIFVGLLGLSAIVFFFGVLAGNEIAKQNAPDASQLSSTFPLPSPPPLEATPAPVAASTPAPAPIAAASVAAPAPPPAPVHSRPAVFTPVPVPSVAPAVSPPIAVPPPRAASTRALASASTPEAPVAASAKRPFNIQIEAVMDRDGADRMVSKLRALGYPATSETTDIDGATWYRVRVGPYDSQQDAEAAQARLRQQYKAAYGTH